MRLLLERPCVYLPPSFVCCGLPVNLGRWSSKLRWLIKILTIGWQTDSVHDSVKHGARMELIWVAHT